MSANLQSFHTLLRNFRNREMSPSVMLLLAWIVVCDDSPGKEKPEAFAQLASRLELGSSVSLLLNIAKGDCVRSLQLASEIVQLGILPENKDPTIDVCISLAIADRYLSISENLILRYVGRLLGNNYPLKSRYLAVTGTDLPTVWGSQLIGLVESPRRLSASS